VKAAKRAAEAEAKRAELFEPVMGAGSVAA